jgi:putative RecB family exonuclease
MGESWAQLADDEKMSFDSPEAEQVLLRQATDLVKAYLAYASVNEKPLAVEATVEMPLIDPVTGEDLGIPLLGIMDLILDGENGPVISDFKTSSKSAEPPEISHEIQLTSYAYLFRRVEQRQEAGLEIRSLVKTKTPKIEFHRYSARTEAHFRRLFAVVREYLVALDCGRFCYRPGWGCSMCDYRETHCRRWTG